MATLSPRLCLAALALTLSLVACKQPAAEPQDAPAAAPGKTPAPGARKDLPPPVQVKEAEPNDVWQKAEGLPARAIVTGEFAPKKGKLDDDWYKLSPGPGVSLALQVELAPRGAEAIDATLEVLDRDRNRLVRLRSAAGDPLSLHQLVCTEACYLKLTGASGGYTLTVLGGPPEPGLELEPNDRAVDATPLAAGEAMRGYYGSATDQDWFKLLLPELRPGQFLRLELSGVPGVRAGLEVRSLDGTLVAEYRGAAEGEPIFIRNLATTPPPLAPPLHTSAAGLEDGGTSLKSLETPLKAPSADIRTADEASRDSGTALDIADAATSDSGTTPDDAGGSPADAGAPVIDAGTPSGNSGPAPAGYYLVVKSTYLSRTKRGANAKDPYTLLASLESGPADLELEPNDDPQHATDLGPGLSRSGYLAPAGDVDWYRVRADKASVLHVELSALERADVELSVWSAPAKPGDKPQLLARANEGGVKEGEVLPAVGIPAGDSFIKVESALRDVDGKKTRDGEDRQTLYKLTAQLAPDDGTLEREPNDAAHPQPATLPFTVKGFIWPRKDVDVFQFHVPEGQPPITIRVSAVRGVDLQLELRQLGPDGKGPGETIGTADAVKGEGEESIVAVPVKPGDYQVEVSSPRHKDASATQGYTLSVQ